MKTRLLLLALALTMTCHIALVQADEQITVTATGSDISDQLDLKAVATLFAESKNLEEFETRLNTPDSAFTNLDLNGDGEIDYLRVVETASGNQHLIIIQAVLAKDIFQDVATIYVEKDETTQKVTMQVVGDEYIYGTNYVIEPVFYVTPAIYSWFWAPTWTCWYSPYYWGYYPTWWYAHPCWTHHYYLDRCHRWHSHIHYCSYRRPRTPHRNIQPMIHQGAHSRQDYAKANPNRAFSVRQTTARNAHELQMSRASSARITPRTAATSTARSNTSSRTYGSTNIRTRNNSATTSGRTSATARSNTTTATTARSTGTTNRSNTATTTRTTTSATRNNTTATTTRSQSPTTTTRNNSATTSRSNITATTTHSNSSSTSRSTSSGYTGGSSSRSSSYSSGSTSRSSGYSGGGSARGGYSGGSHSSGASSGRSAGGHSAGGSRR